MSLLNSVLKVFVGDKTKKDLAKILPLVDQINSHFNSYKDLSNDELRDKTLSFKNKLSTDLKEVNDQIQEIKSEIEKTEDIDQKENLYQKVDNLTTESENIIAQTLEEILPEAFAVVKETARRFVENYTGCKGFRRTATPQCTSICRSPSSSPGSAAPGFVRSLAATRRGRRGWSRSSSTAACPSSSRRGCRPSRACCVGKSSACTFPT